MRTSHVLTRPVRLHLARAAAKGRLDRRTHPRAFELCRLALHTGPSNALCHQRPSSCPTLDRAPSAPSPFLQLGERAQLGDRRETAWRCGFLAVRARACLEWLWQLLLRYASRGRLELWHGVRQRTKVKRGRREYVYLQMVEGYRDERDRVRHRVVANLGREDDLKASGSWTRWRAVRRLDRRVRASAAMSGRSCCSPARGRARDRGDGRSAAGALCALGALGRRAGGGARRQSPVLALTAL